MTSLGKFDQQLDGEVIASLAEVMGSLGHKVTTAIEAFTGEAIEFQILTRQGLMQVTEHLRRQKREAPVVAKSSFTDAAKKKARPAQKRKGGSSPGLADPLAETAPY
jgi:hypothetical protein